MKQNTFIWADLSSYHPQKTKKFYEAVFNWKYYNDSEYLIAYKGFKEVAGLYQTPLKFQEMKMPSFWMSYIQVDNVLETVEEAKSLGGIIELVDTENQIGKVALIRDVLGAGFTVYEGNQLNSKTQSEEHTLIYNELQVSNIQKAVDFYQRLFDWEFDWLDEHSVDVLCSQSGKKIASIYQVDSFIRGKYEYWVCTFGVKDVKKAMKKVTQNNGIIVFNEGNRALCSDGSEAFFYIQEV